MNALDDDRRKPIFVVLTESSLRWMKKGEDLIEDNYIGLIKLPFIYSIERLRRTSSKNLYAFVIKTLMHYDRNKKESGRREVIFHCLTERQRDMWIAGIEYLKTRAIYDDYVKKNQLVNFLGCENDLNYK